MAVIALNFPPKFLLGICLPSYSGRGDSLFLVEQCEFRLVPLVEVTVVVFPKLFDELGEYCITFFRKIFQHVHCNTRDPRSFVVLHLF